MRPGFARIAFDRLELPDVGCLWSLLTLHNLELHFIAFLKALVALGLYGAEMDEHIGTVLLADESKALPIVEPLNCACRHVCTFYPFGPGVDTPR